MPRIGNLWGACDPNNEKNRRTRASVFLETRYDGVDFRILIDSGPDLRTQFLRHGLATLDAVLYTHAHADHLNGIDELRLVNRATGKVLPAYGNEETIREISTRFGYVFEPPDQDNRFFKPCLKKHIISGGFSIKKSGSLLPVMAIPQDHGGVTTLGFRIGDFAYSVDLRAMSEAGFERLRGVQCWVVDCYSYAPHPTHSHLDQTLDWIERVGPKRAILTHMPETLDYEALLTRCPEGVVPAYDGMTLSLPDLEFRPG